MSTRPVAVGKMAMPPPQQGRPGGGIESPVLFKLIFFSLLMAVVPIGTYFGTLKYAFDGSATMSAICAVVAANIVLVGYVIVAFREEAADRKAAAEAASKSSGLSGGMKAVHPKGKEKVQ